jgi:hypothetical protein
MRVSQILVVESDTRLTAMLEVLQVKKEQSQQPQGPLLRHPRDAEECLELLAQGYATVLVLKIGRHIEEEMGLLSVVSRQYPDTAIVVVGETVHAHLAGLAWDLGASYVLILPQPREMVTEVVAGLLHPAGAP